MDQNTAFCRTCLRKESMEHFKSMSVDDTSEESVNILEMISLCVPELDLHLVKDPVICLPCLELLKFAFKFKTECLFLEEKFMKYVSKYSLEKVDLKYFYGNVPPGGSPEKDHNKSGIVFQELNKTARDNDSLKFSAENCKGCFSDSKNPSDHSRCTNLDDFQCDNCSECFKNLTDLRKHIYTKHIYLRSCHICGKSVRDYNMLTIHLRTHTKEKPFACKICKKKFRQQHALKEHILTHDKDKNNKNKCDVCGKILSTKYNLKIHMNKHFDARPKCKKCGKWFYTRAAREKHATICANEDKDSEEESKNETLIKSEEESVGNNCDMKIKSENEIYFTENTFTEFKNESDVDIT